MGDVFILGAGFSKAVFDGMPVLAELGELVWSRVGLSLPAADAIESDLELWLTYLAHEHPWLPPAENLRNHALLLDVSRAIGEVLSQTALDARAAPCPEWLPRLIQHWHEREAAVITLNYDVLVERVASGMDVGREKLGCDDVYPVSLTAAWQRVAGLLTGERQKSFRLFKLHGSVNWFYSGSATFYGETVYFVPVSGGWTPGPEDQDRERSHALHVTDKIPLIVPPVADKLPYFRNETVRSLWSQAAEALRSANRVFCLGYSLPVTDVTMRFFFHSNRPAEGTAFYVVNTDQAAAARYRSLLPEYYHLNERYIGPESIPNLVEALTGEEPGPQTSGFGHSLRHPT